MSGDYTSMIRRPTDRGVWNELESKWGRAEKQSEFKKPYLNPEEDYSEMEHFYPDPLPFLPHPPGPLPIDPIPGDWVGWYITGCHLTCDTILIRDCDKEYCCMLNPAWQPVSKIEIEGPATLTKIGKTTGEKICFTLNDDAESHDLITIKVNTKARAGQLRGGYCEGSIRVGCDKCNCAVEADVAYSDAGSDDTIDRDGTATITITGGCPPYHWSVAGTGFSFSSGETNGLVNTLSADNTACGSATITVTDKCGDSCTGYVRGTAESDWVICGSAPGGSWNCSPGENQEETVGQYKHLWRCCQQDYLEWRRELTAVCGSHSVTKVAADDCPDGLNKNIGYLYIYKWDCV